MPPRLVSLCCSASLLVSSSAACFLSDSGHLHPRPAKPICLQVGSTFNHQLQAEIGCRRVPSLLSRTENPLCHERAVLFYFSPKPRIFSVKLSRLERPFRSFGDNSGRGRKRKEMRKDGRTVGAGSVEMRTGRRMNTALFCLSSLPW